MDAPAFAATGFARPSLLVAPLYIMVIMIVSMEMVKPAHAAGAINPLSVWNYREPFVNGKHFSVQAYNPVGACIAAVGSSSTWNLTTTYAVCGVEGVSNNGWVAYSSTPAPAYSTCSGLTCTCNTGYMPDPTGTSCIPANNCPANMSGSPCACIPGGYVLNPNGAGCVQEQYSLSEPQDQTQLPDVEPGKPQEVTARVTSVQTGQPKQGAVVRFRLDVDLTSGGHDHGETYGRRSRGAISSSNCVPEPGGTPDTYDCTTGPEGYAGFTFNAPAASGTHTFTATCISHACSGSETGKIDVKVGGLAPIPADPVLYAFVGGEADKKHHDNHYLTDNALSQLVVLAINYHFLHLNDPLLHLNDASLVWGGLFDKNGDWNTPHNGHQRGTVIDIRANQINEKTSTNAGSSIPESLFNDFEKLAAKTKTKQAGRAISAQAQLHCSDGFDPETNCVGDNNRHYHVILLGVDQ